MSDHSSNGTVVPVAPGFLQVTLDALSTHVAILDEHGTIIKVNAAWHRFARENHFHGEHHGLGDNYLSVCDAATTGRTCPDSHAVAEGIRALLAGKLAEFTLEYPCHGKAQQRWFVVHITRFGEGTFRRVVVAHENITARKQMETALQANEQRLCLALEAGGLGAFEHIIRSDRVLTTPGFCAIFGWPFHDSFHQDKWIESIHSEDRAFVLAAVQKMLQNHTPLDIQYRISQIGETERWIRAMASPLVVDGIVERVYGVVQNITERKQAEAEWRQFARATEQSPASVVITDLQGGIKYVNPKFCAVTGYTFEEVRGKNPRLLKSGAMSSDVYQELWTTITQGKEWRGEFHNRKKNGEMYWESASISAIRNTRGKITDFIAVKEDITLRKQAVEELAAARQFLDQIINTVGEPIFVKDRQHRWIMMNDANCALINLSREEIVGKTVRDMFPQNEADVFWTRDEEVFTSGNESLHEETFTDAAGAVHTVVTRKNRYCNDRGELFLVGVLHDITQRKAMETSLRESERRQKAILDNIGDPAWLKDSQGRYLAVNQPLARLFGRTPENMIGQTLHDLYPSHADSLAAGEAEVILSGKAVRFETQVVDPLGTPHWFETIKSPILDEHSRVSATVGIARDITDRRRAAHALADAKQFLDRIINTVSEPIFVKDRQHRYVMVNAATCLVLGRDRDKLLGFSESELFSPETANELWAGTETVFETGRENIHEKEIIDSMGHVRHLVARLNLYCNDLGEKFVVGVFHDITQRKKLEETLRESDRRQKAILDNIPDPAWLRDTAGRFLMVNQAWSDFTGVPKNQAIGKKMTEIPEFLPDTTLNSGLAIKLDQEDQALLAANKFFQQELQINFAQKGNVWFEVSKTVLVNESGQPIGITGIARDITERKQADAAQKEQIVLRERLANLAGSAPGILYSFRLRPDGSFCIPYISPTVVDFLGVLAEDALDDAAAIFNLIPLDDIAVLHESIAESARTLSPWRAEFRLQHPRKGLRWIEGRSSPQRETDGCVLWHGFMSDITDRKLATEELAEHKRNEERSRLELEREHALNQVKTRFVSLVSHEFRTPLCAINMAAFMLSDYAEGMTQEERVVHARDIQHAVGRMTQMMEDFLIHDKVQTGRLECQPAWVNVADFCEKLIPEVAAPLHPTKIVAFHAEPDATKAFLDLKILRHILTNLLSNAIKYSADDQLVTLEIRRISLAATRDSTGALCDFLEFKVADSGIGIPAADLANLYQTFHRASNVGNRPGTGMGLAIVKQFVDLHGGSIQVESTEDKGTTFWVRLPVGSQKQLPGPSTLPPST